MSPTNLRRAASVLARFQRSVESADAAPTPDALAGLEIRREDAGKALAAWREFLRAEVPALDRALESAGLPSLSVE